MIKELVSEIIMQMVSLFAGVLNLMLFFAVERIWLALAFLFLAVMSFISSWYTWGHIKDMVEKLDNNLALNNRHITFLNDAVSLLSGGMTLSTFEEKHGDKSTNKSPIDKRKS